MAKRRIDDLSLVPFAEVREFMGIKFYSDKSMPDDRLIMIDPRTGKQAVLKLKVPKPIRLIRED